MKTVQINVILKEAQRKEINNNTYICTFRGTRHELRGSGKFVFECTEDTTLDDLFATFLKREEVKKVIIKPIK